MCVRVRVCVCVCCSAKFIFLTIYLQRETQIHHLESMQAQGLQIRLLMNVRYTLIDNFIHAKIWSVNLFCYIVIAWTASILFTVTFLLPEQPPYLLLFIVISATYILNFFSFTVFRFRCYFLRWIRYLSDSHHLLFSLVNFFFQKNVNRNMMF